MASEVYVGKRLSYGGHLCTVRYVGEVKGTNGDWLGVEWDDATRGKHSGEHGGIRYFECRHKSPTAASFVRPTRTPDQPRTFVEGLRYKYASDGLPSFAPKIIQIGKPRPGTEAATALAASQEKPIRISGKVAEEVGFEKIRQKQAALQELKIVLLDGLCMARNPSAFKDRPEVSAELASETDVKDACPKATELDVSCNLFEEWREIAQICVQLEELKSLRVDESRFRNVELSSEERERYASGFKRIQSLTLNETLMSWTEVLSIVREFENVTTLSASHNAFTRLDIGLLPATITDLTLEANNFRSLSSLRPLTALPNLARLLLKQNRISSITDTNEGKEDETPLIFSPSLTHVDLSHNSISDWSFIDSLPIHIPSLTSLRISSNPLYLSLVSPDGKPLSPEDGYILTVARISSLRILNYSPVSDKDRLNAETYYLSNIGKELSLHPESLAETVKKQHRRYAELCDEYGEPAVARRSEDDDGDSANPNSLAAQMIKFDVRLGQSAIAALEHGGYRAVDPKKDDNNNKDDAATQAPPLSFNLTLPLSFTVYNALGIIGKTARLPPSKLRLFWETGEWDPAPKRAGGVAKEEDDEEDWDSEAEGSEDGFAGGAGERGISGRVPREVELVAGTRLVGTWIDVKVARVRVEMKE